MPLFFADIIDYCYGGLYRRRHTHFTTMLLPRRHVARFDAANIRRHDYHANADTDYAGVAAAALRAKEAR